MDKNVFSFGFTLNADLFPVDNFFVHLYNSTSFYPVKKKISETSLMNAYLAKQADNLTGMLGITYNDEVDYRYNLKFEVEPGYDFKLGKMGKGDVSITAALPFKFEHTPGAKYGKLNGVDSAIGGLMFAQPPGYQQMVSQLGGLAAMWPKDEDDSNVLRIEPWVEPAWENSTLAAKFRLALSIPAYSSISKDDNKVIQFKPLLYVFLYKTPLPMELKLEYTAPLFATGAGRAYHELTFSVRAYFKAY